MILVMTHTVEEKGKHMHEEEKEKENRVLDLGVAFIVVSTVLAVVKTEVPATLQTKEVPVLQVNLTEGQQIFIPYETNEERDKDYNIIMERVAALRW